MMSEINYSLLSGSNFFCWRHLSSQSLKVEAMRASNRVLGSCRVIATRLFFHNMYWKKSPLSC